MFSTMGRSCAFCRNNLELPSKAEHLAVDTDTAATTLQLAEYADDTTVYLHHPKDLAQVLKIIGDFGAGSGYL